MPIVHSGADHQPQASRTQGHDQPVYFPSGPLQRVPGAAAVVVAPTAKLRRPKKQKGMQLAKRSLATKRKNKAVNEHELK